MHIFQPTRAKQFGAVRVIQKRLRQMRQKRLTGSNII
jgi:hypothetical protein